MSGLEAPKKLWGRGGHDVPGTNPNYAGRIGIIAAGVLIVIGGAFALLTGGNTQSKTATRYITDVTKDESMQSQLYLSVLGSPAASRSVVRKLVQTLLTEDQRLSTQHWPARVTTDIEELVSANQQQISVLNRYTSAPSVERAALLKQENNDAYQADFYDTQIRTALNAHPVVT